MLPASSSCLASQLQHLRPNFCQAELISEETGDWSVKGEKVIELGAGESGMEKPVVRHGADLLAQI